MRQTAMKSETTSRGKTARSKRAKMLSKIHLEFGKLCPGLSAEETREARLDFCTKVLSLRAPLESMRRLSDAQLGRVIEAIKAEKRQPRLPGNDVYQICPASPNTSCGPEQMGAAEVIHLAGPEQVWAINQVFGHLHWSQSGREKFLQSKYKRSAPTMLTPKQANSCLVILFTIAAHRDLKAKHGWAKVPRSAIRQYIPELKSRLGIDQKKVEA